MANPIEMPQPLAVRSKTFDLSNAGQIVTPVGAGWIQTIERTRPFWVASYESPPLSDFRYGEMQSFLDALEGSKFTFIGFDPRRSQPLAAIVAKNPVGNTPWGAANITASSFSNSTLTITLGSSYTISQGDYLAVLFNSIWYLFRSRETKTGTSMTLKVGPRPVNGITGTLRLTRAGCEMKVMGQPKWTDSVDSFPSVSFQAVQYIERTVP